MTKNLHTHAKSCCPSLRNFPSCPHSCCIMLTLSPSYYFFFLFTAEVARSCLAAALWRFVPVFIQLLLEGGDRGGSYKEGEDWLGHRAQTVLDIQRQQWTAVDIPPKPAELHPHWWVKHNIYMAVFVTQSLSPLSDIWCLLNLSVMLQDGLCHAEAHLSHPHFFRATMDTETKTQMATEQMTEM